MHRNKAKGFIRPLQIELQGIKRVLDLAMIFLTLAVSLKIYALPLNAEYLELFIFSGSLYGIIAEQNEIYRVWRGDSLFNIAVRICGAWIVAFSLVTGCFYTFDAEVNFSKTVLELWLPLAPTSIIILHSVRRLILAYLRKMNLNVRYCAILGANELGERVKNTLAEMPWLGYKFVGFYDDRIDQNQERLPANATQPIGNFKDLLACAQRGEIDHIYLTLPLRAESRINDLIQELADSTVSVNIVPDFFIFNLMHSKVTNLRGIPIVSVFDTPLNSPLDGLIKRIEDLALCSVILPLIALPMLIIGTIIKLSSPGPVIFKQLRYGVNGEAIKIWKFRSMTVMENGNTVTQATANDKRVTPFGNFLRRTSLDELPQFINVLQGTMSVVGPRPHAIAHNEYYRKHIQGYMLRHKMKPGITGLAQVNGCRGETETMDKMEARIHYDLDYIRQWSVFLDLKIVAQTIFKGFVGENVY
ncbi:undecaprenyl-phosphate glucose phosphotransferase [Methylomonas sp. AM2-LC]|uniref:undecaprenyl-phosphate glucose phosphotransferase n=1 Tax=Methylomonas sp. AM2-LC TaxID=3153301 RepID=UPI00326359FA